MRRTARVGRDGPRHVPSGASTGSREAIELRDGETGRYGGKGVLKAVEHINTEISAAIMGLDASEQAFLDKTLLELDGTDNKSRLGANAHARLFRWPSRSAAADEAAPLLRYFGGCKARCTLPVPMMNIVNGGAHADNSLDVAGVHDRAGRASRRSAKRCAAAPKSFHALKKILVGPRH